MFIVLYSVGADEGGGDWMSECSLCCIQWAQMRGEVIG